MSNYYLCHHGIKGQKWGVRRYQNSDGSLTNAGKKRYGVKQVVDTIKEKRRLKKEVLAEMEKKAQAEKKHKILTEGSAEDVLSIRGQLSDKELSDVVNRLRSVQNLESMKPHVKTGMEKVEETMNKVGKIKGFVDKGVDVYNTVAKINNSFNDDKLPTIDGKGRDKEAEAKKKKEEADKKERERIEKIVNGGTTREIMDNFGSFTSKDLSAISLRMKYEKEIAEKYLTEQASKRTMKEWMDNYNEERAKNGKEFALLLGYTKKKNDEDDKVKHSDLISDMTLDELYHHGVKGQKWGVRRYQNSDGSLTPAGKKRVQKWKDKEMSKIEKRATKETNKYINKEMKAFYKAEKAIERGNVKKTQKAIDDYRNATFMLDYKQRFAEAEYNRVKNMSVAEIDEEKAAVGKAYARTVYSVGVSALARLLGSPVAVYSIPNTKAIRRNYRVDAVERQKIEEGSLQTSKRYFDDHMKPIFNNMREEEKRRR